MCSSARALHLNLADTGRWLWSYYSSRLPGAGARIRGGRLVQIAVRDEAGRRHRAFIRNNGRDWGGVEEIFLRRAYRVDLADVHCILDLGGNIGLATLALAGSFPGAQICTVEPVPDNLAVLRRNVESCRPPVRVVAGAVGAEDGQAFLHLSEDPQQHSLDAAVCPTGAAITVDVFSVPSLMALMAWDHIDLLKIDIEGGEKYVLGGQPPWLSNVRCIVGEGHTGAGYTIDVCRRDLEPAGFEVQEVDRGEGAMTFLARRRQ